MPPNAPPEDLLARAESFAAADKHSEALACVRQAMRTGAGDNVLLWRGSVLLATLHHYEEAVDCITRLSESRPLTAPEEAFLAQQLFQLGAHAEAVAAYRRALTEQPDHVEYAISGSVVLMESGHLRDAAKLLLNVRQTGRNHAGYLYQTAGALNALRRATPAIRLAQACVAMAPEGQWDARLLLANILSESGRHSEGLTELRGADDEVPAHVHFVRSVIRQRLGYDDEALVDIAKAIEARPDDRGYRAHQAAILSSLSRFHESAEAYRALYERAPDDIHLARAYFGALVEAGHFDQAIPIGAHIVARHPGDESLLDALKGIIERQARKNFSREMNDAYARLADRFGTPPKVTQHRGKDKFNAHPFLTQCRVIAALLLRETRTRFGKSRLGYAWVMFEPLAHIGIMVTLVTLLSHNGIPPIGPNFTMFYFTGIIPYHMVTHTIAHVMKAIPENRPMLQLPVVKSLDVYLARGILELATEFFVTLLLLLLFSLFGLATLPISIAGVIGAMILLWLIALGLGILFSVFAHYFPGWERIWGMAASLIYFSSGIFYVARGMPEWIRNILAWNPVLQGIEMLRKSYFHEIDPFWLDIPYLCRWAVAALAIGLCAERLFRRKLLEVE